jgi:hypothetical protein
MQQHLLPDAHVMVRLQLTQIHGTTHLRQPQLQQLQVQPLMRGLTQVLAMAALPLATAPLSKNS